MDKTQNGGFILMSLCSEWKPGCEIQGLLLLTALLGYMDFLCLWKDAVCVIADSGGVQEKTTALKVPCITRRKSTERPITAEVGSNEVIGLDYERLKILFMRAGKGSWKKAVFRNCGTARQVNGLLRYSMAGPDTFSELMDSIANPNLATVANHQSMHGKYL